VGTGGGAALPSLQLQVLSTAPTCLDLTCKHQTAHHCKFTTKIYAKGRAIRFTGTTCRPELCEPTCPGGHYFYQAKIIPPPPDGLAAMAAAAAAAAAAGGGGPGVSPGVSPPGVTPGDYAAALGRPIELTLDLHPRLRRRAAQELLWLDAEALQVCCDFLWLKWKRGF